MYASNLRGVQLLQVSYNSVLIKERTQRLISLKVSIDEMLEVDLRCPILRERMSRRGILRGRICFGSSSISS
jgi:hypothetical protein